MRKVATVKAPRFRIAWLMVAVAVVALDFAAIRAALGTRADPAALYLLIGALPMANVLVAAMLIARQFLGSRPLLLGFEVLGAFALAVCIVLAMFSGSRIGPIDAYLDLVLDPLESVLGQYHPIISAAIEVVVAVVMLVGPQLVLAVIGGFVSRRFKITIARR